MYRIAKQFHFAASHQLLHLTERAPDHQCARLHGHNYVVEVELTGSDVDDDGFVLDYGELKPFGEYLDGKFDHRHLNDVLGSPDGRKTTAERLARHLHAVAHMLVGHRACVSAVRVSETPKTWAEYRLGTAP